MQRVFSSYYIVISEGILEKPFGYQIICDHMRDGRRSFFILIM